MRVSENAKDLLNKYSAGGWDFFEKIFDEPHSVCGVFVMHEDWCIAYALATHIKVIVLLVETTTTHSTEWNTLR